MKDSRCITLSLLSSQWGGGGGNFSRKAKKNVFTLLKQAFPTLERILAELDCIFHDMRFLSSYNYTRSPRPHECASEWV